MNQLSGYLSISSQMNLLPPTTLLSQLFVHFLVVEEIITAILFYSKDRRPAATTPSFFVSIFPSSRFVSASLADDDAAVRLLTPPSFLEIFPMKLLHVHLCPPLSLLAPHSAAVLFPPPALLSPLATLCLTGSRHLHFNRNFSFLSPFSNICLGRGQH